MERFTIEVTPTSVHTLAEAGEYLRCSYGHIYKMAKNGEIATFKIGNQWRIKGQTLIDLTDGNIDK